MFIKVSLPCRGTDDLLRVLHPHLLLGVQSEVILLSVINISTDNTNRTC